MKNYSYSKIDQYYRCPLAYKLLNIDKVEKIYNPSLISGRLAHKFMEIGFLNRDVKNIKNLIMKDKDIDLHNINMIDKISHELENLINNKTYKYCIEVEYPISMTIGPYNIRGIIDRIDKDDNHYTIIDYKYGYYEYTQNNLEESLQLKLYAYYIMNEYNQDRVEIKYHNLKQNTIVSIIIHKEDINVNMIENMISDIEFSELLDTFPPRVSSTCIYCSVRKYCKPFKNWLELDKEESNLSVDDFINYYYDIQEKEKFYKKQRFKFQNILNEIIEGYEIKDFDIIYNKYGGIEINKH